VVAFALNLVLGRRAVSRGSTGSPRTVANDRYGELPGSFGDGLQAMTRLVMRLLARQFLVMRLLLMRLLVMQLLLMRLLAMPLQTMTPLAVPFAVMTFVAMPLLVMPLHPSLPGGARMRRIEP